MMRRHSVVRSPGLLVRLVVLALLPLRLYAQAPAPRDSVLPDSRLFHRSDLYVMAAFGAATVALFPLDRELATSVRDPQLVANKDLRRAATTVSFLGSPGPFIIGGAMYVVGRYGNVPRMAHLAVHGTEAVFVGLGVAGLLKTTLGRARPYITGDTNPNSFVFLRGFRSDSYQAFPSGHATTAFAVAAAVTSETHDWWPRSTWVVGPVLYGGATLVGLSRMYEDKHWASDVVMGAAVGIFAGLKTVRFNHTRSGNRLDRWLLGKETASLHLRLSAAPDGSLVVGASGAW